MKLLAFSTDRSDKIEEPLAEIEDAQVVAPSREQQLGQYFELFLEGQSRIRKKNPDLLLVNRDGITAFITAVFSFWYGVPLVIRLGGDPWKAHYEKREEHIRRRNPIMVALRQVIILLNRVSFWTAAGFIVVSEDLKSRVVSKTYCSSDRVRVVHTSIDSNRFMASNRSSSSLSKVTEDTLILTVTNLQFRGKYEGIRDALPAIEYVLSEYENVGYVIAGGGMYYRQLRQAVAAEFDSDIHDRIYTPGYVADIESLYSTSDIFVYMSYIDGYPNVVLEAKAASLPVITNPKFGMSEQITDSKSGFLISPTDTDEITERLGLLVESKEERDRMGQNGRTEVITKNNPEKIGHELVEALRYISNNR